MQIPYHIKVDLKEYYESYWRGEWEVPDISEKCHICNGSACARYLGIYIRTVICPITGFEVSDFPILRFYCFTKGKNAQSGHVTFSLLPLVLVPYRQLTLKFMILAVYLRLSRQLSLYSAIDAISFELINLEDIGDYLSISAQLSWEQMVKRGFYLFTTNHVDMPGHYSLRIEEISTNREDLLRFLDACIKYQESINNEPIRGPDGFTWDFYCLLNQQMILPPFLFGTASQHKN